MRFISALLRALQHSDEYERKAAVFDLCEHHQRTEPRVLQALSQQLGQDESQRVRQVLVESLGKLGMLAVPLCLTALNDADPSVRGKAAQQLGAFGDERALAPLMQTLQDDHQDVRYAAAEALLSLHSPAATAAVIQYLQQHYLTSKCSLAALIHQLLLLEPEPAVELLLQALTTHPQDWARQEAAQILAEVGDARAIQPLIAAFDDPRLNVKETAAQALVQLGPMAMPALQAVSAAASPWHVLWASYALVQLGEFDPLATLLDLLQHPFWEIRQYAISTLVTLGDRRLVKPLLACLKDPHDQVRWQAVQALGELRDERAVAPLLELAQLAPDHMWRSIIEALSRFDHPSVLELMLTAGRHPDPVTRYHAILALKAGASEYTLPLLVKALEDPDREVRRTAAQVLGDRGEPQAVRPLLQRLKQTEGQDESIIAALVKIGKPTVVPLMAVLKTSTQERLRYQAIPCWDNCKIEEPYPC